VFPALILSSVTSVAVVWLMLRFAARLPQDMPNERSLHERPVPRTGGVAVLGGIVVSLAAGFVPMSLSIAAALCLAVISFADDLYGLPTSVRLIAHLSAAGLLVWYTLSPMEWWKLFLLCLAVGWITNLYNFMDGADGLAGGMSVIGFGAYALASSTGGDSGIASLSAAICGAAAGFLVYNFHPARIFLGDVGSIPLGFLAASLGIVGWRNDVWPLWFPLLVFGPFIADATITLLRRIRSGGRFWTAHREHYYQRMVRMGFGHRSTAYVGYGAMVACAAAALLARDKAPAIQAVSFGGAVLLLAVLAVWIDWRWARHLRRSEATA
jgi:UDP-N-acetylmuramyl pentapeptide phosphotransferase/UDP-N-acetylglucosamine-1-phosphate transferase